MIKFITDIIGSEVLVKRERLQAGKVAEVIISPDDGVFLGVTTNTFPNKKTAVPASEIQGIGDGLILIKEAESIGELEDIIRIKEVIDRKTKIIGQKVFTESGQRLGKCVNATLNLKYQKLDKIYVSPGAVIAFLASDLIIPAKNIVEIKKDRIVVTDEYLKVKAPKLATNIRPAID
jgi:uncharacterized protein YrrD